MKQKLLIAKRKARGTDILPVNDAFKFAKVVIATVCPRSLVHYYVLSIYFENWTRLLGNTVRYVKLILNFMRYLSQLTLLFFR